jgi:hypothetical protein
MHFWLASLFMHDCLASQEGQEAGEACLRDGLSEFQDLIRGSNNGGSVI